MQAELVPESRQRIQARERKECVGKVAVDILGRMEYRPIGFGPGISLEKAEIKNTAMVDKGYDTQ